MKNNTFLNKRSKTIMPRNLRMLFVLSLVLLNPVSTFASPPDWQFAVGMGSHVVPAYTGSDKSNIIPAPYAQVTYKNNRISSTISILDGMSATYTEPNSGLFGSISMNSGGERNSEGYKVLGELIKHSKAVETLLNGSPAVETNLVTGFMAGRMSRFGIFSLSLEHHSIDWKLKDDEKSYQGFLSAINYVLPVSVTETVTVTGIVSLNYMDQNYADAWYSVKTPTPRLKAFEAGAGFNKIQGVLQLDYMAFTRIGLTFQTGHTYLLEDAADSPYTTKKYLMTAGISVFYTF